MNQRAYEAVVEVNKYVVRVEDPELRRLVYQLRSEATSADATFTRSEDEAVRIMTRMIDTHAQVSTRLGEILRSLY
jgi:hypothetical protein